MGTGTNAWRDFREAAALFTRPVRFYLGAEFLMWTAHGIFAVLFNLYLVEAGASAGFVGRAVSASGAGMVLAALPAGWLADRWGRRRTLMLGAVLEGAGHLVRALSTHEPLVLGGGLAAGLGQSLFQIAAAPFLTDHSTPRERTHLFATFFASALFAGVVGNNLGGLLPSLVRAVAPGVTLFSGYRAGRRVSWNHVRSSSMRVRWSSGAWRWHVAISGVPSRAAQRTSTQSLGL